MEEQELIHRIKQGSRSAFEHLVRHHQDMVYSVAYGVLDDRDRAKDVAQEVFSRVWRSIARFDGKSKLSTWIYRITYNKCLDEVRSRSRFRAFAERFKSRSDENYSGQIHGFEKELVHKALQKLREQDRALLAFYYLEELDMAELEEVTGIAANTLKTRLHRARTRLREILENDYGLSKGDLYG